MEFITVFGKTILWALVSIIFSIAAYSSYKKTGKLGSAGFYIGIVALTCTFCWVGFYPTAMREAYSLGWFGKSEGATFLTAIAIMFGMVIVVIHCTVLGYFFTKDEAKE